METSVPPPPPPTPPVPPAEVPDSPRLADVLAMRRWWSSGRPPQPGQLTPGWRLTVLVAWVLAFLAWSAAWKTSRELGLSTWWLGPSAESRPFPVLLLPFVPIVAMIAATLNNVRRLAWYGLAAGAVGAAIAVGDLGRVVRLGLVELAIAVATAAVSVASLSGTYRSAAPPAQQSIDGSAPDAAGELPSRRATARHE